MSQKPRYSLGLIILAVGFLISIFGYLLGYFFYPDIGKLIIYVIGMPTFFFGMFIHFVKLNDYWHRDKK